MEEYHVTYEVKKGLSTIDYSDLFNNYEGALKHYKEQKLKGRFALILKDVTPKEEKTKP